MQIHSPHAIAQEQLTEIRDGVASALQIPGESVWITLNVVPEDRLLTGSRPRPIVFLNCRQSHAQDRVQEAVKQLSARIAIALNIADSEVFCAVQRLGDADVTSPIKPAAKIELVEIGRIRNARLEAEDDDWNSIESVIELSSQHLAPDATAGLEAFSHVDVVFYMHKVKADKIVSGARHPRNNVDWPKVGILAQRGKNRPNQIGVSCAQLIGVDGLKLRVRGLDAIDGTPVLDVKPRMSGFDPQGDVREPAWSLEIMSKYY